MALEAARSVHARLGLGIGILVWLLVRASSRAPDNAVARSQGLSANAASFLFFLVMNLPMLVEVDDALVHRERRRPVLLNAS